jgi:hypothetical protein
MSFRFWTNDSDEVSRREEIDSIPLFKVALRRHVQEWHNDDGMV